MTALLRFLAGVMLLVAVIFAVIDATRSGAGQATTLTVHHAWVTASPHSLTAAQGAVQRYTHPVVWNWGVLKILQLPAWAVFGFVGLILAFLGRRRRHVNVYAN